MKSILLLLVSFLLVSKISGQQLYITTSTGSFYGVTINGNAISSQPVSLCASSPYSIAMYGNTLYSMNNYGIIQKADLINGSFNNCTTVANVQFSYSSFTVNAKNILYLASYNTLYTLDPKNPVLKTVGIMPYTSAGDLIFYKDNLYMAAPEGIVLVNLNNPALSTLVLPISSSTYGSIYGLATALVNNKIKIYAFGTPNFQTTNMIDINLDNKTINGIAGVLPYVVYDAASPAETGTVNQIKITNINLNQECEKFNQAKIQVTCAADTNQYTYKINNGQSNTTGIFNDLTPGNYNINIISASGDSKDTTITVPNYAPATQSSKIKFN